MGYQNNLPLLMEWNLWHSMKKIARGRAHRQTVGFFFYCNFVVFFFARGIYSESLGILFHLSAARLLSLSLCLLAFLCLSFYALLRCFVLITFLRLQWCARKPISNRFTDCIVSVMISEIDSLKLSELLQIFVALNIFY